MAGQETVAIALREGTSVGERLRIARVAAGLSPKAMARRLGVSLTTYQRIERNERELRLSELHAAVAATGQDIAFFGASLGDDEAGNLSPLPGAVKEDNGE